MKPEHVTLYTLSASTLWAGLIIGIAVTLGSPELGEWLLRPLTLTLPLLVIAHFVIVRRLFDTKDKE
jgi:membrane protein DedA with SNARE-associated domain